MIRRFFFFKQKTAYEMLRSLVGSEMCIRDSFKRGWIVLQRRPGIEISPVFFFRLVWNPWLQQAEAH